VNKKGRSIARNVRDRTDKREYCVKLRNKKFFMAFTVAVDCAR
jgi:hypothetical protein